MPELAEVEFFRRRWDPALDRPVLQVHFHPASRVWRGLDPGEVARRLAGAILKSSRAHGKQLLFQFHPAAWLGLHLGMTGELRLEPPGHVAGKHDHLILVQKERALVFTDPRQFGRLLFHAGQEAPAWWSQRPPDLLSRDFLPASLRSFLARRRKSPLKAILLMQECFPGIGNWMADEILWRCRLHPGTPAGRLAPRQVSALYRCIRSVCAGAMRHVAPAFSDPPRSWLFQHRWKPGGRCPRDGTLLERKEIGGRTTCWCPRCQPPAGPATTDSRSRPRPPGRRKK